MSAPSSASPSRPTQPSRNPRDPQSPRKERDRESSTGETPSRSPFARGRRSGPRANFRQLLPYLTEHKGVLVWAIVLSVLSSAASLAQPLLVNQVINLVQNKQSLGFLVWVLVALVIASGIIGGYQHYLLQRTGESVVLASRRRLVARLLSLPISEFDARRTGDLVSRVGSDTTMLRAVLTQGLIDSIAGILTIIGAVVGMAIIDPLLLLITVVVIGLSVIAVVLLSGRIRFYSRRTQDRVGDLTASIERAISAVRTVRASGATEREVAEVDQHSRQAWDAGIAVARISALVVPVSFIAIQVSFLAVIGVGGYQVASGTDTVAKLVTFIMLLFMMIMPLGNAFGAVTSVNSALGALGRIEEIIALPGEADNDPEPVEATPDMASPAIEFDTVSFAYPALRVRESGESESSDLEDDAHQPLSASDRHPVLTEVSFAAPRGTRTAIVGPSGAGKSTILALIERFYDPSSGVIRLGGQDIRYVDRKKLRAQIGYVEQDAPILAGSIRANLTLATPEASDADCERVLHAVNLGEVLERTTLRLDAPVGEDGVMLSGGERQRLAIARALLAAPPILLLDESTSSLDGRNEQLMREAIDAVAADRTLLVIAHRLSTVVDSEQIIVLDHGRVIGVGTHSELVGTVPLYRELAKHQLLV